MHVQTLYTYMCLRTVASRGGVGGASAPGPGPVMGDFFLDRKSVGDPGF